ncbi:MAG: hypothetical protein IK088_01575, partial [Lachnospiraceae bacterium]|nr:hypothetical protein [Lachnospiraceae bacterium]
MAASSAMVLLVALFGVFGLRSHMMVRTILIYLAGGVLLLSAFPKPAWKTLFRFRYLIAGVLFLILVVLGVNGSSAGHWNLITGTPDNAHLIGVSRGMRSDEWALFTPMSLAQYVNPNGAFSYFNPIFSGSDMDMFLMYGQPVWDVAAIFRPFFFGYLFLPADQGIAWFWCGRVIALFMVSFEFGRMITGDRRAYALMYALLLTFSPFLQWWFAINGLVEMVIYTELAAVLMRLYLRSGSFMIRTVSISGILFSAAGFLLSFYPAWMVPLAYLVLALLVSIIFENRKEAHLKIADLIAGAAVLLFVSAVFVHVALKSWGSIELTMNTAFPGKRVSTGGGSISLAGQYLQSVLYPIQGLVDTGLSNESELSQVI